MTISIAKDSIVNTFPKTRYQGSKYKLVNWIKESLIDIEYTTVLDAFSGTSSISYMFKDMGKEVISNDIMPFNSYIATALIKNKEVLICDEDINYILTKHKSLKYDDFIYRTFPEIYYTDEENKWLDIVVQNIHSLECEYKKSMFFWALFQSCIIKRPYNLFHRKNLYVRTSEVKRSFGNKKTWDKSFEEHFKKFIKEINNAVFDNQQNNQVLNKDIFDVEGKFDLVYIDTPYIPQKGSITKYLDFYHFLNGIISYNTWATMIDYSSKNLKLKSQYSIWEDKKNILNGFEKLLEKFKDSKIVISYRIDGIPTIEEIVSILESYDKKIEIKEIDYKYALSKNNLKEVLIIAQ